MRGALHAHILCWFRLRKDPCEPMPDCPPYHPVESVPRTTPGAKPKQRPADQAVSPLTHVHEDDMYHRSEMARVTAEMVRPNVSGGWWGRLRCGEAAHCRTGKGDPITLIVA